MIHLYCGDGKGKTTAAMGLALRALGAGWRVVAVQFLKDGASGEVRMLADLPGATVLHDMPPVRFTFQMTAAERAASRAEHDANLARALELVRAAASCGRAALLVLDEVLDAHAAGLVDEGLLMDALAWAEGAPDREVVLTGHAEAPFAADWADYLTRFSAGRHPYERGVAAREGVEY